MTATADLCRLARAKTLVKHGIDIQDDVGNTDLDWDVVIEIQRQEARYFSEGMLTFAIWSAITRILPPHERQAALIYVALVIIAQLMMVESREHRFFSIWAFGNPLKASPLQRFDASKSGNGYDCAICWERIGETEWIYPIPCEHQFHRWCLINWLRRPRGCKRCAEPRGRGGNCPLCRADVLPPALCEDCVAERRTLVENGNRLLSIWDHAHTWHEYAENAFATLQDMGAVMGSDALVRVTARARDFVQYAASVRDRINRVQQYLTSTEFQEALNFEANA
ncbi:uncharacterized protein HMPREF1541_08018 [Cyphellophora europaea CBS 101466]|uniref:RING-type domain-containing protein n=1 Tax=Cyphellophora europaea (strain CBS 101466) TaxID=1220924 RepID=W2RL29_CYPE1|nr:uncharacterized protein HMPREF1541_08018 [Cyphellophora europaea CBS 101466]ETN37030.1 hypothetical protein HMPREF1541_08018 [Cyphellophora europaea CBS 101466]